MFDKEFGLVSANSALVQSPSEPTNNDEPNRKYPLFFTTRNSDS